MRVVLATRNPGKVRELAKLLHGSGLDLETLADHPEAPEVEESGATYAENAAAKARAVAEACRLPALADDSGLEVDALDGRPGVHSARYGGGVPDNVRKLLTEMEGVPTAERTARFRCVLVLAWPDGRTLTAEGTCEGSIAPAPRGSGGFGYDPVFVEPTSGLAFAELSADRKDAISHRARAIEALRASLHRFV